MKTLKVFLSVFALVSALGVTFATQQSSLLLTAWEYDVVTDNCIEHQNVDCTEPNETACVINNITMREKNDAVAQCGKILGRPQ